MVSAGGRQQHRLADDNRAVDRGPALRGDCGTADLQKGELHSGLQGAGESGVGDPQLFLLEVRWTQQLLLEGQPGDDPAAEDVPVREPLLRPADRILPAGHVCDPG